MKINMLNAYIAVGIVGGLAKLFATGYLVGDIIRERGLKAKKLKVLEEIMKKDSDSKVEYLLNPQLFRKE